MLKRITQQKDYLLFAGIVLMAIIGYQLAFKRTLEAWQLNNKLKDQLSAATNLSYQPDYQKRKNANLDQLIQRYKADTLTFRTNSISAISGIAAKHDVQLSEVPVQGQAFDNDKFIIQKLTFEGGFYSLIRMLHELRRTRKVGFVLSADFRVVKSKPGRLLLDLYFQGIVAYNK